MIPLRHAALVGLLIWIAAILQGRAAHALALGRAQPDLPLVALACGAQLLGSAWGIRLGFWAGLLAAAASPQAYGSVFLARIAAGAFAGGIGRSLIRDNLFVPPLVALTTTILAEAISLLMAPGPALHHARHWFGLAGGGVLYNALLALPASLLLRLLGVGRQREDSMGRLR